MGVRGSGISCSIQIIFLGHIMQPGLGWVWIQEMK